MIENEILDKVNSETNGNVILKRGEDGSLKTLDCAAIIKNFLTKNSISHSEVEIKKTNEGLSNYIYYVSVDNTLKLFLKIFNNKIDRKFEEKIIRLNAEQGNCARILDSDYTYYRIEEFLENIQKLERKEILTEGFFEILVSKIINFNLLLSNKEDQSLNFTAEKNVFDILQQTFSNAHRSFEAFKHQFEEWKTKNNFYSIRVNDSEKNQIQPNRYFYKSNEDQKPFDAFRIENYEKIEHYLAEGKLTEILNEIFPNHFLGKFGKAEENSLNQIPLLLSHNDVHQYNFLYKPISNALGDRNSEAIRNLTKENVLLIDYEYACFNVIGFDIVNFFIESFFNLEFPEYPFYQKLENSTKNIYNKFYYEKFIKFLNDLVTESAIKGPKIYEVLRAENFIQLLGNYQYYCKVCRLASIYWFYTALQFLDFDSNVNKSGFNYVDYSIDRLSIYENFNKDD